MKSTDQQEQLIDLAGNVLLKNYRQQPMVMRSGAGTTLVDVSGREYLDMTAGIAVCALGHSHPALTAAIREQAGELLHVSNLYYVEKQILAAEAITSRSFCERVFFANSGAEANEAALKLARRYQHVVAGKPEKNGFIAAHGSFHGRTFATVAITGQEKYRAGLGPLIEPVRFVPYGDSEAVEREIALGDVAAVIVEPIQAEGGIIVPPAGYLAELRRLCDESDTILIFDEVQTGVGRTGQWFGHQVDGVVPDVMTMAKGLGGGVPVGAVGASERAAAGLTFMEGGPVPHASTFGGNPLACAAVIAVLETIDRDGLLENCRNVGEHLGGGLSRLASRFSSVCIEARGRGLLRGLALSGPAAPVVAHCRERGLLLSVAGGSVVRFAPPLIVTVSEIDRALGILEGALAEYR